MPPEVVTQLGANRLSRWSARIERQIPHRASAIRDPTHLRRGKEDAGVDGGNVRERASPISAN